MNAAPNPAPRRATVRAVIAVAALAVVGVGLYLVLDAFTVGSVTFRFVDEVAHRESALRGTRLKMAGSFVAGSRTPAGPGRTTFTLEKAGFRIAVVAPDAALPGGFDVPGRDVVVDGTLDARGVFQADDVTTGCPSRYEGRRR